jgi:pimeloyl-ACP methyl ester carboxylesterase
MSLELPQSTPPPLEDVPFKTLYRKETYDAPTADGWVLQVTRYRPVRQEWHQPLLDEPLLLVPGWSQNRHAFSCGDFVKRLLMYGGDVHILELRGHGKSSRELQVERADREGRSPPDDLDFQWDLDSYLLHDIPAGVRAVKERTGREKIFYVGHSMGGMLGYGYASQHDDLAGLVTLGAPGRLGQGFALLKATALLGPALVPLIDLCCFAAHSVEHSRHAAAEALRRTPFFQRAADVLAHPESAPRRIRFDHLPVDLGLSLLSHAVTARNLYRLHRLRAVTRKLGLLLNPARVAPEEFRWLLRMGGEKEPRRVLEQFARWIRNGEMKCYRTGFDYQKGFSRIAIPLVILYGELDKIGSRSSTAAVAKGAASEYRVWRSVRDNSHLELTMGADVGVSCEAICDLVRYARERAKAPAPRLAPVPAAEVLASGAAQAVCS